MDPIPDEMTRRIFHDYEASKGNDDFSICQFVKKWAVSRSWFYKKLNQLKELGHWKTKTGKTGPKRILEPHIDTLKAIIAKQPDATLNEIRDRLPVGVSHQTVANALKRLNLTYKKNIESG
jgi:transposase